MISRKTLAFGAIAKYTAGAVIMGLMLFLSMPMVLESWTALAVMLPYPLLMAVRIGDEERLLEKELAGYSEYKKRVPWRMVPFIW